MIVIIVAIIALIVIAAIFFFMFKAVLGSVNISVEEEGGETTLNITTNENITDLKIVAYIGKGKKDQIVSKRKFLNRGSEPIQITYRTNVRKIHVTYKLNGEKNEWDYEK